MPMFSEITHRFQTAKPSVRQTLLKYLLPWLHNMELVDPAIPPSNPMANFLSRLAADSADTFFSPLKGEGWGSTQATEMVLNNLFFITVKFGDEHPLELEALWSAIVLCWVNNLKVVLRYLLVITNVAPSYLLGHVKRVVSYLGRAKPEKLVDELMNELQTVETLNMNIERTQTPPYYRLSAQKKVGSTPNTTDDEKMVCQTTDCQLEKGVLHTKRHSANEDLSSDVTPRTNSTASLKSVCSTTSTTDTAPQDEDTDILCSHIAPRSSGDRRRSESLDPYPLPMPAYGGFFAQLNEFLPEDLQPSPGFHRSNIAAMFLSDLVLDGLDIDWSPHLPLMLHIIFLGLDHSRSIVHEHCKKLLQNLLLLASSQDHPDISRLLLSYRRTVSDNVKINTDDRETTLASEMPTHIASNNLLSLGKSTFSIDSAATITPDTMSNLTDPDTLTCVEDIIRAVLNFMEARKGKSLWGCEDITPKTLNTHSSSLLEYFLKCVVKAFKMLSPLAMVEQRWSQTALQLALSCSSRHYAGRSFQIIRALRIRPSTQMLSDILSRLVETVAEQGDDMQGYVTEIMLTLEAAIDNLDLDFLRIDFMKELFMSTPNLAKDTDTHRFAAMTAPKQSLPHHARSTSYTASVVVQRANAAAATSESRSRSSTGHEHRRTHLGRSRSAQSLKNLDQNGSEDKQTLVTQMFWIAVSLLESDYEYEFLLAIRLLDKILCHLQPENPEWKEKLDKMQQQIKWPNFPGLQTLLLKGCTSPITAEATWSLLARLTLCIKAPVIDPSGKWGFAMNTIAMLPYLVANYENPNQTCRNSADNIAQICTHQSLANLATVMSLYSRGTFGKDSFQWTKCVVKYILDVSAFATTSMIIFLVEVLEKGPVFNQIAVLQILHCITHYVDVNSAPSGLIGYDLFHTATKYIQSSHWREALKIVKLAVMRSSTMAAAPPSLTSSLSTELNTYSHTSFADTDMYIKIHKELPGRTLEFSVDVSKTPLIGLKFLSNESSASPSAHAPSVITAATAQASPSGVSLSRKPSNNQDIDTIWRRPQVSQARTRERLVNLLTCFGPRVGLLKSPSDTFINKVIFSQSSDTLDHQHSVASSGEETSLPEAMSTNNVLDDSSGNELIVTFKGFDFLDNELEESENEDFFSQFGDRRHSLNLQESPTSVRPHFGSVPDLKLIGSASLTEITISPCESLSVKEETLSEDEEESENSMAEDNDGVPRDLPSSEIIVVSNSKLERRRRSSPLTASTRSLSSNPSETELSEMMTSSVSSPSFTQLQTLSLNLESDEVEEVWKVHVMRVMAEISLSHAFTTFQIFPKLFRELRRRLMTMTKEACYYISKTESLKTVASQILQILDLLYQQMECPFIFIESDSLIGSRVLERHRFCILEIQECFETYSMRKDQSEQSLEALKSSIKQQSLGDGGGSALLCGEEQKVNLCRRLYKLVFQLVLLFESYLKLLDCFHAITSSPQVTDMSPQATALKGALHQCMLELENGQASPFNVDCKAVSKQEAVASLAEYIHSQKFLNAIQLLRSFRSIWPNDMFGMSSEDDITTLLNIFCSCLAEKKSGIFVLTRVDLDLNQLYGQLMDINVKLTNDYPQSLSSSSSRTELVIRHQDSSTL